MITKFHRPNKFQKEIVKIIRLFKMDADYRCQLNKRGIKTYVPVSYRIKLWIALTLIGLSFVIPFTSGWLIPLMYRWLK